MESETKPDRNDFEKRRSHLAGLSDEQLAQRFWELTEKIVSPLIDLAQTHTSPSIERSVLLRCGFSSTEASQIVSHAVKYNALGYGVGALVLRLSQKRSITVREAGLCLAAGQGWEEAIAYA
ncbi:MAG: ornithine aminomutase subunit alpha [Chitinivibrionales bacterium]|nr:ornithine aminomutase subunit alpha [Chitinivibrionales bacterium]